jgi:hypothetical protein
MTTAEIFWREIGVGLPENQDTSWEARDRAGHRPGAELALLLASGSRCALELALEVAGGGRAGGLVTPGQASGLGTHTSLKSVGVPEED